MHVLHVHKHKVLLTKEQQPVVPNTQVVTTSSKPIYANDEGQQGLEELYVQT